MFPSFFRKFKSTKAPVAVVPDYYEISNKKRNEAQICEFESLIGKLVIVTSNEVENVLVGVAERIELITQQKKPVLLVQDIVSGETIMPFGAVMAYTDQKFDALNNMDPLGRIAILYDKLGNEPMNKTQSPNTVLIPPAQWQITVQKAIEAWQAK